MDLVGRRQPVKASNGLIMSNLIRAVALLLLAAGFWFLQTYGTARPQVVSAGATPQVFSAARAEQVLARILGPEKPHPVSTNENARVRGRVIQELQALGLHPFVHHGFACHSPHGAAVLICASVNDVIAQVLPGQGRAILLLAHYDSVPAGPGAADDESGVATVIETGRALVAARSATRHPVLAVLTDGEEADLLGAASFLHDPSLKAQVGAVINVEARGNRGPSILFQTSPGDAPLINLYAQNTPNYVTSSLYHEIYRFLPNDTDLTLFIADGFPSFNFAYVGGIEDYHTANDTRANLDPVSLQEQGDNMLGVARGLEQADFAQLHGSDAIYFDVLGRWLPRVPQSLALPLAILAFLLLLVATVLSHGVPATRAQWLCAFAIMPALIIIAAGSEFVLYAIAQLVSGMPDPSYAHPAAFRISLAFELGAAALLVSRLGTSRPATAAVWLWYSAFGVVASLLAPGLSPYFILPAFVAAVVLLIAAFAPGKWDGKPGAIARLFAALVALLVWSAIGTSGEMIGGLALHPIFTIPFAIALSVLVPLLAGSTIPIRPWAVLIASLFVASLIATIVQGSQPSYSPAAAQRLNVTYFEADGRAFWTVNASAPLPRAMRAAVRFSQKPEQPSPSLPLSYVAAAGAPRVPLPTASVISDRRRGATRSFTLALHGSEQASQIYLEIPGNAKLKTIDVGGWHYDTPSGAFTLACMSRDCGTARVMLTFATTAAVKLGLYEHRFALPGFASRLVASRPSWAVQSQNGDGVTLVNTIDVPAVR